MYSNIIKRIKEHDTIIIHRHTKPDGDAMGSQIGLKEAILATFPKKKVYAVGEINEKYSFVGEVDEVTNEEYNDALVIVLDTSEEFMISDDRYKTGKYLIKIDHHIPKTEFGNLQIVDTSFESCAGLVTNIIFNNNMNLSDFGARALFCGIVTDSGRFRFDSVSSRTFELTSRLLKYNFDMSEVYNNLYLEDLKMVKLRAKFILNFKLTEQNVAYTKTTAQELKDYDADLFTISRGMVNTMGGIKGIDIWVNFTEDEKTNTVIAEIRSSKYNINEIALKYGGGGHQAASGATLKSFSEADLMLADLNQIIKDNS
jgi:phosphoesterase RecJ-like protein